MASLQLPPPRKSAPVTVSSIGSHNNYQNNVKTSSQQQQQLVSFQDRSKSGTTAGNLSSSTTTINNNNNKKISTNAPSYEERCKSAALFSKLTPEQRKVCKPLFVPRRLTDFDDGGAFPEIHVAQYPRHMGNPHLKRQNNLPAFNTSTGGGGNNQIVTAGSSRAIVNVEIDRDGKVSYDSIVKGGTNSDRIVYSKLADLKGGPPKEEDIALPTPDEERDEAAKTQAALMSILQQKTELDKASGSAMIQAATSQNIESKTQFIKYTAKPDAPGYNPAASTRVIQMVPAQIDPMMPPKHKHLKAPRGPAEDPVPVLHAPPRKLTKEEREQWNIPACISNWKNARGYTIPLDKRLAADGRGLLDKSINSNNFANLSESLYVAEQQARQEVKTRALIQKKQIIQEKTQREEELRQLANQARLERSSNNNANSGGGAQFNINERSDKVEESNASSKTIVHKHDNDVDESSDDDDSVSNEKIPAMAIIRDDTEDEIAARQREKLRMERKRERERELRMEKNMELKKKQKFEEERDVSEKIALGVHTGTGGGSGADVDSRLYNQSSGMDSGFGAEDEYNAYTKPLFGDRAGSAGAGGGGSNSIYRPTRGETEYNAEEQYDKLVTGSSTKFQQQQQPNKGFSGASGGGGGGKDYSSSRSAPVQFEKEK